MSDRYHDQAPPGLAPAPGFSQVVSGSGRLVFVSGQVAIDENGQLVGEGDVVRQAEQAFANVALALAAAGASFADLVKLNYYFVDIGSLPAIRPVRDRFVDTANPPAATAVEVRGLFRPEYLVEIEALALVRSA